MRQGIPCGLRRIAVDDKPGEYAEIDRDHGGERDWESEPRNPCSFALWLVDRADCHFISSQDVGCMTLSPYSPLPKAPGSVFLWALVEMASLLLGFAGWRSKASATRAPTLAELFALLGRHLLPALVHPLPNTLIDSPSDIGARKAMGTPASEEDPAQRQKSQRLPERDLPPAEERRQQPIPQVQHDFAADGDKYRDRQDRQRSKDNPFLSHVQFLMLS